LLFKTVSDPDFQKRRTKKNQPEGWFLFPAKELLSSGSSGGSSRSSGSSCGSSSSSVGSSGSGSSSSVSGWSGRSSSCVSGWSCRSGCWSSCFWGSYWSWSFFFLGASSQSNGQQGGDQQGFFHLFSLNNNKNINNVAMNNYR
jgi:hypothetical protein